MFLTGLSINSSAYLRIPNDGIFLALFSLFGHVTGSIAAVAKFCNVLDFVNSSNTPETWTSFTLFLCDVFCIFALNSFSIFLRVIYCFAFVKPKYDNNVAPIAKTNFAKFNAFVLPSCLPAV